VRVLLGQVLAHSTYSNRVVFLSVRLSRNCSASAPAPSTTIFPTCASSARSGPARTTSDGY
jgi:hypothetical protein